MEQKTLNGSVRSDFKKRASRRLRKEGKIPAIVYGHTGTHPVVVDAHEFSSQFHTVSENTIISLKTEKKTYDVLVKDFQENILTGMITHIDFYEIERGKALKTHIPIHLEGVSPGVREGGILEHPLHDVEVECLPKDLPGRIMVDINSLDVGDSIHIFDIEPPEGVKFLTSSENVVVAVTHRKAEILPEEEEEGLEEEMEEEEGEEKAAAEATEEGEE